MERLKTARVAVAGLGGLGSNIAVSLARIGVGHLFLVDFDVVEPSNLNRQHYNTTHLGQPKTDALKAQINLINPSVAVDTKTVKVTAQNAAEIFKDYTIICEAFDKAENKAALVNALLEAGGKKIVSGSGMGGWGPSNKITTKKVLSNLYVCGDGEAGEIFLSPRVMLCAAHQANLVLRLLLGEENE